MRFAFLFLTSIALSMVSVSAQTSAVINEIHYDPDVRIELCHADGRTIDKVDYKLGFPWPKSADGDGEALQRIRTSGIYSGNNPENWRSDEPSLGSSP
jgi:hypothetical protein